MAPLTKVRHTREAIGDIEEYDVAAGALLFAGAIGVLNAAGLAIPGAASTTLLCVGRVEADADNTGGADGAIKARIKRGIFRYANSAGADEITAAEIGDDCFIVDDQTVAKTDGTSTRSVAGKVVQVDAQGVWVALGITLS